LAQGPQLSMMKLFLSALLSVCSAATVDPSQPSVEVSFDRGQEQISLHPPAKPFPEVSSHIAALNAKRDALDKAGLEQVRAAFNGQAASFFERTTAATNGPSVRVTAGAVHPVDAAINAEIDALDAQIAGREAAFFKHAVSGIAPQLRASRSSFLQRRVQTKASDALADANIKITNSKTPWPTVAGLALGMIHTAADSARVTRRAVLNEEAKVLGRAASFVEAEATIPGIVSQVPAEMRGTFGSIAEHDLADAISSAVQSVAAELGSDAEEFSCTRQYSDACPEGFTELSNGLCEAPREGRPSGCPGTIDFRGLTPGQKSARAQQCGRRFRCASSSLLESTRGVTAASNDVINIQMEQAVPASA